ncbi:hypothetical protein GCM10023142_00180 [Anaerocolumna aminovalerica]|uniref:Lysine exporter LysO n=1 Tax=Anaerocolumna aminovalerica TaxID=1527 RepID=A0A1I5G2I2_9FIRM|nr:LysO family transporter [Anaerocolumna aminovalerica]MBU5331273.1 LysO family transporter [Anaerocolumna aminovalerica]SFO30190.1 Membrane protein of unknown function [Anaerocolumna aminovalerica]
MEVLIYMLIGIVIGFKWFPLKLKKWNERIQVISISILIFLMGVTLGSRPNFLTDFLHLGLESLLLAIIPIIFSVLFVYFITKYFFK